MPRSRKLSNSIIPKTGLKLDLRDPDGVWSVGEVIYVLTTNNSLSVTDQIHAVPILELKYLGWAMKWNERIPLDSPRLAPLHTFTRKVKGVVEVYNDFPDENLSKKKKKKKRKLTLDSVKATPPVVVFWPCKIYLRMPDPIGALSDQALVALKTEPRVFVEPYAIGVLNAKQKIHITAKETGGDFGIWVEGTKVLPWDDTPRNKASAAGYSEAAKEALDDEGTASLLPLPDDEDLFEEGSLLNQWLRAGPADESSDSSVELNGELQWCYDPNYMNGIPLTDITSNTVTSNDDSSIKRQLKQSKLAGYNDDEYEDNDDIISYQEDEVELRQQENITTTQQNGSHYEELKIVQASDRKIIHPRDGYPELEGRVWLCEKCETRVFDSFWACVEHECVTCSKAAQDLDYLY